MARKTTVAVCCAYQDHHARIMIKAESRPSPYSGAVGTNLEGRGISG
jgi:hypothetical protein